MPEHKMITIDGIRVRADEASRYRARTAPPAGGQASPLTAAHADPRTQEKEPPADPDAFDPGEHTVLQVIAHLAEADEQETARILDAEAGAKDPRKGLVERRDEFLAEARQRAAGGPGGGA
ncbi:hypothetical protein ACGFZA_31735 [Streptomyces sp. NPDC048211]|uniref:hypothetical protein n=1 Tax=Streptomyces sp. NPDC048211 TaxID=3365516 RepID=UPI003722DAE1